MVVVVLVVVAVAAVATEPYFYYYYYYDRSCEYHGGFLMHWEDVIRPMSFWYL